jgi:hypothetical protein
MTIRRTADWQESIDDRILEHLAEEPWSTTHHMASLPAIHATEKQVRDRCCRLADVDLVSWIDEENLDMIELTTEGKLYLDGELDVKLYPAPRESRHY